MKHCWLIPLLVLLIGKQAYGGDMTNSHVSADTTIGQLLNHPAFAGFGRHLLTRENDATQQEMLLRDIRVLLPYHSAVDIPTIVASLNHMIDNVNKGDTVFYPFYTEQERLANRGKASTGLFFLRGKPGAPFAVICPGGGFSYVGSFHEGFPYAMELNKRGYNAFVLRYRVGGGASPAVKDLAAALSFIFRNANEIGVGMNGYSLWGSSAGARMVAYVGTHGTAAFGGDSVPKPSTVIMAYTGHTEYLRDDPPTFAVIGVRDDIVAPKVMEKRIENMRASGIDAVIRIFPNVGHGFGLGVGTSAEGWINDAIQFWKRYIIN